jgi:hypothetical protein
MASCCPQAPWRRLRPPACGQSTSWPVVFGGTARPSARLSVGHGVPVTPRACARTGEWGSRRVGSRGMATAPARRLAADAYIGGAGNGGSPRTFETIQNARLHKGSWSRQMVREARHDSEVGKEHQLRRGRHKKRHRSDGCRGVTQTRPSHVRRRLTTAGIEPALASADAIASRQRGACTRAFM